MRRIIADGGSTPYGYHDEELGGWANRLSIAAMRKSRQHATDPIIIKNDAEPGRTLPAIAKTHTQKAQTAQRAGAVTSVLQVGLNESKIMSGWTKPIISLERFGAQALQFCEIQRESGIRTVLIGPQPVNDSLTNRTAEDVLIVDELTASYGEVLRDASKLTETAYIDTRQVFAGFALEQVLDADGYHPSPYGHELIHQAVQRTLQDMGTL